MNAWACFLLGAFAGGGAAAVARRRQDKRRAALLSFAAHELNTPLATMNMTAINFLDGVFGPVTEAHRPWLEMLREQAVRLQSLVGDLRDLAHLEFHRDYKPSAPRKVALPELVDQALRGMREALTRSRTEVAAAVPPGLPAAAGDEDQISRVLLAMLYFARKFLAKGPIRILGDEDGGQVRVAVEFSGPKPSADYPSKVLDLFYPVSRPDSQALLSTGLGLGLSRLLLESQGGSLALDARDDGTNRIEMRLPRHG